MNLEDKESRCNGWWRLRTAMALSTRTMSGGEEGEFTERGRGGEV